MKIHHEGKFLFYNRKHHKVEVLQEVQEKAQEIMLDKELNQKTQFFMIWGHNL